MKIIFYLPVNTVKAKFVAFLVFVCMTASFIGQISSSENDSKPVAILAPIAKPWIAKDIPSYGSQSKHVKIAIHCFGKYLYNMSTTRNNDEHFAYTVCLVRETYLHLWQLFFLGEVNSNN